MSAIALLLPGQGSQFVGMGRDLAQRYPEVRGLYAEADELLDAPLSEICWEGPEDRLTATENAQPAILLHSFAVWQVLPEPVRDSVTVAAGHSLGEFTAHLLAGTLDFREALRLVRRRGELMGGSGKERPGTMAAIIGLDGGAVRSVCAGIASGVVVPANFNAPGQVVISGDVEAVEQASVLAAERGARRVLPLPVSGAFHSPLMAAAADGLRQALEAVQFSHPRFPVVANATACPVTDAETARETMLAQLTAPVRWVESIAAMREVGVQRWLELGPGTVLAGLLRRIDRSLSAASIGVTVDVAEQFSTA